MRGGTWLRGLLVLVLALAAAGCNVQAVHISNAVPSQAPDFRGTTTAGTTFDLAQQRGKVVVVDFWGSWCGPCLQEQPFIDQAVKQFQPLGVVFIGVAVRDNTPAVEAYIQQQHVPYPSIVDTNETITGDFNITAPPTLIVINQHGQVVQTLLGTTTGLTNQLDSLLGRPTPTPVS